MKLSDRLQGIKSKLPGVLLSKQDANQLRKTFSVTILPEWLLKVLSEYPLMETSFTLSEDDDQSELGAELKWMNVAQMIEEGFDAYPGIVAVQKGYLPVGMCLMGSGDPYFLKFMKVGDAQVVRIPHEAAINGGESLDESQIELVTKSLGEFFKKAQID